jgi:OTU domain-containing protein 6
MEKLKSVQRKEVKALEGERRGAVKKTKATAGKGKKGKEAVAATEAEYDAKAKKMADRHTADIAAFDQGAEEGGDGVAASADWVGVGVGAIGTADAANADAAAEEAPPAESKQEKARRKKLEKKQRQIEKERERETRIEEENAAAGPGARDLEIAAMKELYLDAAGLELKDVPADGHCLFRAVADRLGGAVNRAAVDYMSVRSACADALLSGEADYAPFAECPDGSTFGDYVNRVRSSADWGGHLELRALAAAYGRTIVVYSADAPPLRVGDETDGDTDKNGEDILLSFHRHYYALGEHYNAVVRRQ